MLKVVRIPLQFRRSSRDMISLKILTQPTESGRLTSSVPLQQVLKC